MWARFESTHKVFSHSIDSLYYGLLLLGPGYSHLRRKVKAAHTTENAENIIVNSIGTEGGGRRRGREEA